MVVGTTCCAATDVIKGRFLVRSDRGKILLEQAYAQMRGLDVGNDVHIAGRAFSVLGIINPGIDHLPFELSAGQQQRVAIARALVHGPAIVFADEPTGDVDPETAKTIWNCLDRLVRENQTTMIACTHGEFSPVKADRQYLLKDGTIERVLIEPTSNPRADSFSTAPTPISPS